MKKNMVAHILAPKEPTKGGRRRLDLLPRLLCLVLALVLWLIVWNTSLPAEGEPATAHADGVRIEETV